MFCKPCCTLIARRCSESDVGVKGTRSCAEFIERSNMSHCYNVLNSRVLLPYAVPGSGSGRSGSRAAGAGMGRSRRWRHVKFAALSPCRLQGRREPNNLQLVPGGPAIRHELASDACPHLQSRSASRFSQIAVRAFHILPLRPTGTFPRYRAVS